MTDVLSDFEDGIAFVRLNRPKMRNALNASMLHCLIACLKDIGARQKVRAVLLTGDGQDFCSGAELSAQALEEAADAGEVLRTLYNPLILEMRTLPKPIVVAINGAAAGAGMSIALAGDILLGSETASFYPAFSKIGLIPDAGSTFFLPRAVGEYRARAMTLLSEPLTAHEAARQGILYKVVPGDRLLTEARGLAARLARMPAQALALTKMALASSSNNSLEDQLRLEATLQSAAARSEDFREGIAAFLAKRAPVFVGS